MSKEQKRIEYLETFKKKFMGKEETPGDARGAESKRKFQAMVEKLNQEGKLPWFRNLAKLSLSESLTEHVDFRMRVVEESEEGCMEFFILFMIKSSLAGAEYFRKRHPDPKIRIVVMNARMNSDWLLSMLRNAYREEVAQRKR